MTSDAARAVVEIETVDGETIVSVKSVRRDGSIGGGEKLLAKDVVNALVTDKAFPRIESVSETRKRREVRRAKRNAIRKKREIYSE